jgi:hypothetical protein
MGKITHYTAVCLITDKLMQTLPKALFLEDEFVNWGKVVQEVCAINHGGLVAEVMLKLPGALPLLSRSGSGNVFVGSSRSGRRPKMI